MNLKKLLNYVLISIYGLISITFASISTNELLSKYRRTNFYKNRDIITQDYYIVSLHNHTTFSDGEINPKEFVVNAIYNDYSIIAITDHNTDDAFFDTLSLDGLLEVERIGSYCLKFTDKNDIDNDNKKDIVYLLRGEEFTTKEGYHVLGIGFKKDIENNLSLEDTIKELEEQKALIVFPHPLIKIMHGVGLENILRYKDRIDAIEINGAIPLPFNAYYNRKIEEISKKYHIPAISNPDAHFYKDYFYTYFFLIPRKKFEDEKIVEYLKDVIKSNKHINFKFSSNSFRKVIKAIRWFIKK